MADQAYELTLTSDAATLKASGMAGLRYGMRTIADLMDRKRNRGGRGAPTSCIEFARYRERAGVVRIADWPDFAVRGVMLDISRDKVPTMQTLRRLVTLLARWRFNQLQLYMEHTFAYRGHEAIWRGASPMTGAQIRALDRVCRDHGIELVPNQNSLGHMERWLKRRRYAPLAEYDGPYQTPWGETRTKPTTLNPCDSRSIALVASLYRQLLPNFRSRLLNVGCDEPFELGQGKSRAACEQMGAGQVYFEYLMKVRQAAARHGRRIQFWSDWIQREPAMIGKLPRDVIPLVWGYEADHPFTEECRRPAKSGLEFHVCPGTSSWCSYAGRTSCMIENIRLASAVGHRAGASGLLVTDWGDLGHCQQLPVSYPGFAWAAAKAWRADRLSKARRSRRLHRISAANHIQAVLSRDVFLDETGRMAEAWLKAGRVHELSGKPLKNRTVLFSIMQANLHDTKAIPHITDRRIASMIDEIESIRRLAASARPACDDARPVRSELGLTLDVLEHSCRRWRLMLAIRRGEKIAKRVFAALRQSAGNLIAEHKQIWLRRNRRGGLRDSLSNYRRVLAEYEAGVGGSPSGTV
ncbi:MAG: beta-N-acetylhexosaminidase [Phycisphaerae bacterium]|nr:beta-N-acetylhexosaminidase [Phycisphaerae bacterium]